MGGSGNAGDVIGGILTGGAYPIIENQIEKQKERAKNALKEQKDANQRIIDEQKARQKQEDLNAETQAINSANRARYRSSRLYFNRGTILTSPLGLVNQLIQDSGKTLLGS